MIGLLDLSPYQRGLLPNIGQGVLVYYQSPPPQWQVGDTAAPMDWLGQAEPCWVWIGPGERLALALPWEVSEVCALVDAGLIDPVVVSGDRVRLSDPGRVLAGWLLDRRGWCP